MEYNYRPFDRPPPMHVPRRPSSNFFYSANQPIPASVVYSDPDFGHSHEYFRNQMDAWEARQHEKERIIEVARRRRILEAEVRMELMMEREAPMRRGEALSQQPEDRLLEGRIVLSLEERLRVGICYAGMAARGENWRSQTVPFDEPWTSEVPFKQQNMEPRGLELKPPFQQRNVEQNILEVKPASESGEEKENRFQDIEWGCRGFSDRLKAKPDANVSGVKRKAETPAETAGELPTVGILKKRVNEWSCALCQISATSKGGLDEHLRGKKHKSNEAALKAQTKGKNFCIGLFPKKPKPGKLVEVTDDARSEEASLSVFSTKGCIEGNSTPSLQIDHVVDDNAALVENKGKAKAKDGKNLKFWCEHCKKGSFSKKVMERHKKGKKHLSWLRKMKCDGTAAMAPTQVGTAYGKVNEGKEQ